MNKKDIHSKIGVIGGGSWGTAMVKILTSHNNNIVWHIRNKSDEEHIKTYKKNPNYLSSTTLNTSCITWGSTTEDVLDSCFLILLAVPAISIEEVFQNIPKEKLKKKILISALKGMIPNTNYSVSQYFKNHFQLSIQHFVLIAGPCHAEELAMGRTSYLTIASKDDQVSKKISQLFECDFIHTTISKDILGIEYSFIIKNIIAIACGISSGLNLGDNFQSVLVSNGVREMKKIVNLIDAREREFLHSAYLGDLLVTSYSQFSRNRRMGNMLAKGYSIKDIILEMKMVAEGYYASKGVMDIIKKQNLHAPICEAVYQVLYEKTLPSKEFEILQKKLN